MIAALPPSLLERISAFVSTQMGLNFPPERFDDLQKGLAAAAGEFGFDDPAACAEWLLSSPLTRRQIEVLASDLTVGETYFFREKRSFDLLEREILPPLLERRRRVGNHRLRVWCAGCCTGEEPYSLAILLNKLIPDRKSWDVRLLATDINPRFLRTASEAVFGEWSFRDAPPGLKENYFSKVRAGRYLLRDDIRQMVQFEYLNLADDTFPALLNNTTALDLILCRNVLIYMGERQISTLVVKFTRALAEDGWLLVGAAETSHVHSPELSVTSFPGMTAYQKRGQEPPVFRPVPPPPVFPEPIKDAPGASAPRSTPAAISPPKSIAPATPVSRESPPAPESLPPPDAFALASAMYAEGRYAQAAEQLIPLASLAQPAVPVIVLLVRACANKGDLAAALKWGEKALALDRTNSSLHYLCGMIQQGLGDSSGSAAAFKRAIYLDPELIMAHFGLGHLAHQTGRMAEAARNFDNAVRLLRHCPVDDVVPESEGMSAGRLAEMIAHLRDRNLARTEEPQ